MSGCLVISEKDVVGAIEQEAGYLIPCIEGTVSAGDSMKLEKLLKDSQGQNFMIHTSIWYYRLDDIKANPEMWVKSFGLSESCVSHEGTYQRDVERRNIPLGA